MPKFEEKQGLVLVLFLLLFVIGVPLTLLYCMQLGFREERLCQATVEVPYPQTQNSVGKWQVCW